jgi:histone-lysine N-methyltransferase SETMAR
LIFVVIFKAILLLFERNLFAYKMVLAREQIRLLIHFQWIQGIHYDDATKAIRNAYGTKTDRKTAWRWYETFKVEGMRLKDKERTGRPQEINRDDVFRAIRANPTMTTRMLAEDFNCVHVTIENILHEAGLKWRKTRCVPHELTDAQKQTRVNVAKKLLRRQRRSPFLHQLVTMDETWIPYKNSNPHNSWLLPNERAPSTPARDFRQKKTMLCVFWGPAGIIYW